MISFKIASKTIKYLGLNLTKEVNDVYTENHEIVMKKLKKPWVIIKVSYVNWKN